MKKGLVAMCFLLLGSMQVFASEHSEQSGTSEQSQQSEQNWVGTWAASPVPCPAKFGRPAAGDSTYRNVVRVTLGGKAFRVKLSNEFGSSPLVVGSARIALAASDGATAPGSDHALTFSGRTSVTIPEGGLMVSDEVPIDLPALSSVAVSVYVIDQEIAMRSCHLLGMSTNFVAKGDQTQSAKLDHARVTSSWNFVKGIDVRASNSAFAVIAMGDSITDGNASTTDVNHRWPDYLAVRLQQQPNAKPIAVLNEGFVGNRLLHNSEWGPNALSRFDRDVLAQTGARYLILLEGFNDLSWLDPDENVKADDVIAGLSQLVTRAHARGLKAIGGTILPCAGSDVCSDKTEPERIAVNNWIRTSGAFDAVIDFEKVMRDPAKPASLNPAYDSGDHIHPNDAGYEAMAKSIDVGIFL